MNMHDEIQNEYKRMVLEKNTKLSVMNICSRLNISRKTFYMYYKDKYELIHSIINDDLMKPLSYISQLQETKAEDSIFILTTFYSKIYDNQKFYSLLYKKENSFIQCYYEELSKLNKILFYKKKIDKIEIEYQINLAASAGTALLIKWIEDDFILSPRKISELFFKYVTRAWKEDIELY